MAALKSKDKEEGACTAKPDPATEVLFLCSYDGCGKTFVDAGALRKHAHVHGERQYVCHYEGCGKVLCHPCLAYIAKPFPYGSDIFYTELLI